MPSSGCRSRSSTAARGALVGVRRRHPDVDHREVGPVFVDGGDEIDGVADRRDHLGAGLRQQSS